MYKFSVFDPSKVIQGVSSRSDGSIREKNGLINKENLTLFLKKLGINKAEVVFSNQPHSSNIMHVKNFKKSLIQNFDGFITKEKNLYFCVTTADCVPLIFFDTKEEIMGIAHAGYKGILGGILHNMLDCFKILGGDVKNIKIGIAPSIGICCYDVPKERIEALEGVFPKHKKIYKIKNKKYFLDLKSVVFQALTLEGVAKNNIEIFDICTRCSKDNLFSFRGNDVFGRFATVIGMIN